MAQSLKNLVAAETNYSIYLDSYIGSRWKCDLDKSFTEAIRTSKTLSEKARVVSHFWDRCGLIQCVYYEDNKPIASCYHRKFTVADILKNGNYITSNS